MTAFRTIGINTAMQPLYFDFKVSTYLFYLLINIWPFLPYA